MTPKLEAHAALMRFRNIPRRRTWVFPGEQGMHIHSKLLRGPIKRIAALVGSKYAIAPAELRGKGYQSRMIQQARWLCFYLTKKLLKRSLPEIGFAFGGFHHTTVIYGIRAVESQMATDEKLTKWLDAAEIELCLPQVKSGPRRIMLPEDWGIPE